jgi:alpha-mannosidase
VRDMEAAVGSQVSTKEGEWTDWWANGDASGPREVAASRFAKRSIAAALSPAWGAMPASGNRRVEEMLKDLCLFDEHTWGANVSISEPDGLETIGQYTEKSLLAYRPKAAAEWLLGQRARTRLAAEPEGIYVTNTAGAPFTGWVPFSSTALRDDYSSVEDPKTGQARQLYNPKGSPTAKFWVEDLGPATIAALKLSKREVKDPDESLRPTVDADPNGWPASASWPGMRKPLFTSGLGDFLAVVAVPPANRGTIARIHSTADAAQREEMRRSALSRVPASPGAARLEETPHTLVYTQPFEHPRLQRATRRLEIWKREPRARLTVRFDRTSSLAPEVFYLGFAFPVEGRIPAFSNGGVPFVPYRDQLEGSCRDYYAIDGWAHYETPDGHWLWVTRDAPLVTVGGPHTLERRTGAPPDTHRLMAMIFDNFWHTNFVANSHGEMEFQFDLAWREKIGSAGQLADALVFEPVVLINPAARESPELMEDLFRP